MIFSKKHKFIFIKVPRTAGTSIEESLRPYAYFTQRNKRIYAYLTQYFRRNNLLMTYNRHVPARKIREAMGDSYDRYYKFAFVRNPYSWFISNYFYAIIKGKIQKEQVTFDHWVEQVYEQGGMEERRKQNFFITDKDGTRIVDDVGHFENLQEDLTKMTDKIGISVKPLQHLRKTSHKPFEEYYRQEDTRKKANIILADDLHALNYPTLE